MIRTAVFLFVCLAVFGTRAQGETWELFSNPELPDGWSVPGGGSGIHVVDTRSLRGDRSLEWAWTEPGDVLTWHLSPASTGSGHRVFSQWIRLETPLPDARLRAELRSADGSTRSFEMELDFTGWRTAFVPYSSMTGGGSNTVDRVRWTVTGTPPPSGRLYLDQVIVGQAMDTRFQYADRQVPFIWEGRTRSMWENRGHWYRRQPAPVQPSPAEVAGARELREDWDSRLAGTGTVTAAAVDEWEAHLNQFRVRREDGRVRGNPVYYRRYPEFAYPPGLAAELAGEDAPNDFQEFTTLMLHIARAWHRTSDTGLRKRLEEMIVLMAEHLLDQGWAAGSNQGCLFLYGYQSREYMRAIYLARDIFDGAGILGEMGEAARWYGQAGSLLDDDVAPNMDFFNTLAQGQLLSILMEPDEKIQVAWLRTYAESMGRRIAAFRPGDANGFKPDGTTFHHDGHYPAYGIGAISTLSHLFDALRDGHFEYGESARLAFRNVLLAARAYSHPLDWPIGISGRHPFSGGIGAARAGFAALAQYPDPDTGHPPDRKIAAAYLRLWGQPGGALGELFDGAGIEAEDATGFHTFPFANHAVYRSGDWMVSFKGYSRYVWSSEIYTADNRYGRYQSNGTAEILFPPDREASGFREAGWDWNRLPGTTGVHLPLDELESPRTGTLMLRSRETFAGGVTAGDDGAFGMILNEDFFDHTLKARKSFFAADGRVIALGSGITSDHADAPAETTLFQVALDEDRAPLTFMPPGSPVSTFPWSWNTTPASPFWVIDSVGNGFWLPPEHRLGFRRATQHSRHNKTRDATTGDFASGWIDHGVSPDAHRYHYVILPQTTTTRMSEFHEQMASPAPPYEVLRQEDDLHSVRIVGPNRYGFAAFEPGAWDDLPHLLGTDRPCLVWIEENDAGIVLSVANPDLNPGQTENLVSPTGLVLRGHWDPVNAGGTPVWHEGGNTRLAVPAREGTTLRFQLAPAQAPSAWPQEPPEADVAPVERFRMAEQGGPFLRWDPYPGSSRGYIVERMVPPEGNFDPVAFLNQNATGFFDSSSPPGNLAYYRVREWTETGPGPATRSLLVFDPGSGSLAHDFRELDHIDELRADGWTPSGVESDDDWYLTPQGMFLIDNSPTLPASVTAPLEPRDAGRVTARMGVARMANFHARIELLSGNESLAAIQMTTRTDGFLRGENDVSFSDERWDIEHGTLRDVTLEWRVRPDGVTEWTLRYHGTNESADAVNRWEIPGSASARPDRLRLSSGFGSAVNRGAVFESLEIIKTTPFRLSEFYGAWAETVLGDAGAAPGDDASGNGLPNLWEFLLARNPLDPHRTANQPPEARFQQHPSGLRPSWVVPHPAGTAFRVETTGRLKGPWQTLPHGEEAGGIPGWTRITVPAIDPGIPSSFYRLVLEADFH